MTSSGQYYVKSGSDKRIASPQEVMRLFQQSGQFYIDELPSSCEVMKDQESQIDESKFFSFYERTRDTVFSSAHITIEKTLENMNLAKEGKFTLAGLLLFAKNPQQYKPYCLIRCVHIIGNDISSDTFIDKMDCTGNIDEQYKSALLFLKRNLKYKPSSDSFNSIPILEIDEKVLEEALINALLHRDYSKNAVIHVFIFTDRIEIISPGSLPNHLTIENIKNGNSVNRNPTLLSHAIKMVPYSGVGSGIPRIMRYLPSTELKNDVAGEQFKVILYRN
jgi:ATP-dependent DNA helicase RecG